MLVNGKCFMISLFLHQFLHICHNYVFAFDWGTLIATQLIPKTTVFAINNWWNSRILHVLLKAHWTALVAHWPWQAQPNGPIGRKVRPSRLAECESQRCLVGLKLRLVDGSIFYESFIISLYISMGIKLKPRYIWYMFIYFMCLIPVKIEIITYNLFGWYTEVCWRYFVPFQAKYDKNDNLMCVFYIFGEQPTIRIYSPEAARGYRKSVSACVSMRQQAGTLMWDRTLWKVREPSVFCG